MARIKRFDKKAINNRARVKKCRNLKKLKSIHEQYIQNRIYSKKETPIYGVIDEALNFSSPEIDTSTEITERLRYWTVHHRITRRALNDLLIILIFAGLTFLPKDGRTLMRTPKTVAISTLTKGKMWYYGVKNCIQNALAYISHEMTITLNFNFDGLPIAKSSNAQFWPILANISSMCTVNFQFVDLIHSIHVEFAYNYFTELPKIAPMIIAIWCGESKPILNEYIEPFVKEMKSLIESGMVVNGYHVIIRFGLVILFIVYRCSQFQ